MSEDAPLSHDDDFLLDDEDDAVGAPVAAPWTIAIIDDEPAIHAVTKTAMHDLKLDGRGVRFLSAYSAKEGRALLSANPDVAVMLLDVVMETDEAGLDLARWTRDELRNSFIRIVLRTGQPGHAPEERVLIDYDVNDYKEKTELTALKLKTTLITALRSYSQITALDQTRRGLRTIIDASTNLDAAASMRGFAQGVLTQLHGLVDGLRGGAVLIRAEPEWTGVAAHSVEARTQFHLHVMAAAGAHADCADIAALQADARLSTAVQSALDADGAEIESDGVVVLRLAADDGRSMLLAFERAAPIEPIDRELIALFCARAALGFRNLGLFNQLRSAYESTVILLANAAEFRDQTTGEHVRRVSVLSERVGRWMAGRGAYAADEDGINRLRLASMLHDIGKISTPDEILSKPGKLTPEEREIINRHTTVGEDILRRAAIDMPGSDFLTLAAVIAGAHHERVDGAGYPRKIAGDAIPIEARIVAVADVFDALTSERPYKRAWTAEEALAEVTRGAGAQFDPIVVEALTAVLAAERDEAA